MITQSAMISREDAENFNLGMHSEGIQQWFTRPWAEKRIWLCVRSRTKVHVRAPKRAYAHQGVRTATLDEESDVEETFWDLQIRVISSETSYFGPP